VKRLLPLALLFLTLLSGLSACQSVSQRLENIYSDGLRERLGGNNFSTLEPAFEAHQEARFEKVRQFVKAEQLETAEDYLYAGTILSSSPYPDDLTAAWAAGIEAAEMGDDRGFRVAAEAMDRFQMVHGAKQRYGTQYYYVEVIQKWRLYPVDSRTTDAEREAMGVEHLSALEAKVEELNEALR
jgi:hypothetical protein